MKNLINRYGRLVVDKVAARVAAKLQSLEIESVERRTIDRQLQVLMAAQWRALKGINLPLFHDVEFSSYSQNGEDGILHLIFSVIGPGTRTAIEICAGDGIECNTANLVINSGWRALMFDGSSDNIERGKRFYSGFGTSNRNAWRFRRIPPALIQAWITAENVNDLISANGLSGVIDLLSLDLDGMDYWVWKAIDVVSPRVVVAEYNNRFPADLSVTVPYDPKFQATSVMDVGYFGASLGAFTKLAERKGYRLVGANGPDTNAFFVRNDIGREAFPTVSVLSCLSSDSAKFRQKTQYPLIMNMPLEVV